MARRHSRRRKASYNRRFRLDQCGGLERLCEWFSNGLPADLFFFGSFPSFPVRRPTWQ